MKWIVSGLLALLLIEPASAVPPLAGAQGVPRVGLVVGTNSRDFNPVQVNSRLGFFGDSITRMGIIEAGVEADLAPGVTGIVNTNSGYSTLANILCGSRWYVPPGGNLGINGDRAAWAINRVGTATTLGLDVIVVLLGTNDCTVNATAAEIKSNLRGIYDTLVAANIAVVAVTILPRYDSWSLTPAQEIVRSEVNAWILAQNDIYPVNAETAMSSPVFFSDGLHPNAAGAYSLGSVVAGQLGVMSKSEGALQAVSLTETFNLNPTLSGTSGTVTGGAVGLMADGWKLSGAQAGGATVLGSKGRIGEQRVSVSGAYSGVNSSVRMSTWSNAVSFVDEKFEGFVDLEIRGSPSNLYMVNVSIMGFDSTFTQFLMHGQAFYTSDHAPLQLPPGRYLFRTPPQTLTTGHATNFFTYVDIGFLDAIGPTPVSAEVSIYQAGMRRIE